MDGVQGLVVVGRFRGVEQKSYGKNHPKAGESIPGMFELTIGTDRLGGGEGEFLHRLSFFWEEFDGGLSPFARQLEAFEVADGDVVAVNVRPRTQQGSQYVNLDPVRITRVDRSDGTTLSAVG